MINDEEDVKSSNSPDKDVDKKDRKKYSEKKIVSFAKLL